MARLQVESGLDPVAVRPAARPVDAYTQTNEGLELAQLAQGLTQYAPSLSRFAGVLNVRDAEKQQAKGAQAARKLEEERVTYKEAVAKGIIRPSENPWFLLGAKQQFGRASAGQYARALRDAVAQDPAMQESDDPTDFGRFEADFRKQWMSENVGEKRDLNFEKGFAIVDGLTSNEESRFANAALSRIEKRAGERLGVIVGQILDEQYKDNPMEAALLVQVEMEAYLSDNPKAGRIANKVAINAIADWARANYKSVQREDVEGLLRGIKAGTGALFGTSEAKQMMTEVEKQIISMRGAAANLAHNEEVRDAQAKEKGFWSEVLPAIIESSKSGDLAGVDLTAYMSRLAEIDPSPDAPGKLIRLRDQMMNAKGNDIAYREGLLWVHGVNQSRPGQFLSMKQLAGYSASEGLTGSQTNAILSEIQQRDNAASERGGTGSKILGDRTVAQGEQYIRGKMLDPFGINTPRARTQAEEAVRDFQAEAILRWTEIKAITDPQKQYDFIVGLAEQSFRTHASDTMLKEHNKEQGQSAVNEKAQSVFQSALQSASEPDRDALGAARLEYEDVKLGRRPELSVETRALFERLGIPLDAKELKLFFLEWDRNF